MTTGSGSETAADADVVDASIQMGDENAGTASRGCLIAHLDGAMAPSGPHGDDRHRGGRAMTEPLHEVSETDPPPTAGRTGSGAGRLLVAEDDPMSQRIVTSVLSGEGYGVDMVLDGAAAVTANGLHHYDPILMDCAMPGMDGYQATGAIRAQEGSDWHTPIIALTGASRPEDRERCLADGMDAYLSKPVGPDALLALVASFVDTWPQADSPSEGEVGAAVPVSVPSPRDQHLGDDRPLRMVAADEYTTGPGDAVPGDAVPGDAVPGNGPPRDETPALDETVLDQLDQLSPGEDLVAQLAVQFLDDAQLHIGALVQAAADGDTPAMLRAAHTLKGSGANLGATELARLCAEVEQGPTEGPTVAAGVAAVRAELERVRAAFGARGSVR